MSATLLDRVNGTAVDHGSTPPAATPPTGRRHRVGRWLRDRRVAATWLLPLLVLAGAVHRLNMGGAPQRIDDEGTYTAQAYAIAHFGELAHYTYWYDHPPLGWIQIAGWTSLTNAFERLDPAVLAGREAMFVAHLISVVLLWLLGRRLGLGRVATAGAILLYSLSPLAVQFHRTVYLDNVATPWTLGAFLLALAPRRQLVAFAASAACFAVAVLTKETYLLLLPFLAWQLWRSAHPDTRRYTLSVAASLFALIGTGYIVFALVKGELMPGPDRVSLFEGLAFQLTERGGSGSVFDPESLTRRNIGIWLQLDVVLPVAATLAAVAALWVRRLRPFAAAYLFLLVFMLRPGYLPVPYVIAMLPLAVLLVAGVLDAAIRRPGHEAGQRRHRRLFASTAIVAAVTAAAVAGPTWGPQLRGLLLANLDRPLSQAQEWIEENVPEDHRLLVDDAMWVDLVRAGFPRDNVVWYYKADTDPAVIAQSPGGWRDYDYVVSTNSLRTFPDAFPRVSDALTNSRVVASFGTDDQRVDVRRVLPGGVEAAEQRWASELEAGAAAGADLVRNPNLDLPMPVRDLLTGGRVDPRLVAVLAAASARHELTLADVPAVEGEAELDTFRRTAVVTAVDGTPVGSGQDGTSPAAVTDLVDMLESQRATFAPEDVRVEDGRLVIRYDPQPPIGVLPAPAQ